MSYSPAILQINRRFFILAKAKKQALYLTLTGCTVKIFYNAQKIHLLKNAFII